MRRELRQPPRTGSTEEGKGSVRPVKGGKRKKELFICIPKSREERALYMREGVGKRSSATKYR